MDAVAASRQQLGQQMLALMKRELANIVTERQQIEGSAGPLNCAHGSAAGRSQTNAKTWRKESIEEMQHADKTYRTHYLPRWISQYVDAGVPSYRKNREGGAR
jgi:hypothetical protein